MPVVNIRNNDGTLQEVLAIPFDNAAVAECLSGDIAGDYTNRYVTALRFGAFAECKNLTTITLPNCTKMTGSRHFYGCTGLTTVDLSNVETASELGYAFTGATNLTKVDLSKLKTVGATGACFDGCSSLKEVYFDNLSGVTLGNYAFRNCGLLEKIVIGGANMCSLASPTQVFAGASSTWKLYVPANLVSVYKTNTNWNQYAGRILAIPEGGVPR